MMNFGLAGGSPPLKKVPSMTELIYKVGEGADCSLDAF